MSRTFTESLRIHGGDLQRWLTRMSQARWAGIVVAAFVLIPTMSFAGTLTGIVNSNERVSIGRVLAQPSFYHLKIIQMHGTVRGVKILMPHDPFQLGDPCYGSYTFMLEDETGVIEIDVLGDRAHCGTQSRTAVPDVTEGDMVIVQSRIHAPGEYVDKMTSPLPVQHTKTHAIAIRISHTTR